MPSSTPPAAWRSSGSSAPVAASNTAKPRRAVPPTAVKLPVVHSRPLATARPENPFEKWPVTAGGVNARSAPLSASSSASDERATPLTEANCPPM